MRNTIRRLTRGAVFAGIALLLGMTPALGQVAGNVTALDGTPLNGAVIQIWDSYPSGNPLGETTSDVLGDFSFADPGVDVDLRVWATDYYPTVVRGLPSNTENTLVKLIATPENPSPTGPVFPNDFWGQSSKFLGTLVQLGDVVEAVDAANVLLAVNPAIVEGGYLLHAVPDDFTTPEDDGGSNGEAVNFSINGISANPAGTYASGANTNLEIESVLDFTGATVTAPPSIGGIAGESVRIEFLVRNTGSLTQSFDVTVDVDSSWVYTLPKSLIGPLTPGQSEIVEVFVSVPLNATGGFATATVHAIADTYSPANSGAKTRIDVNPTDVSDNHGSGSLVPNSFSLAQNYPNPFNPETQIAFSLAAPGYVHLEVYNIIGQSVAVLVDGYREAGESVVEWDARNSAGQDVPSGVYFYRLTRDGDAITRKMVLMR